MDAVIEEELRQHFVKKLIVGDNIPEIFVNSYVTENIVEELIAYILSKAIKFHVPDKSLFSKKGAEKVIEADKFFKKFFQILRAIKSKYPNFYLKDHHLPMFEEFLRSKKIGNALRPLLSHLIKMNLVEIGSKMYDFVLLHRIKPHRALFDFRGARKVRAMEPDEVPDIMNSHEDVSVNKSSGIPIKETNLFVLPIMEQGPTPQGHLSQKSDDVQSFTVRPQENLRKTSIRRIKAKVAVQGDTKTDKISIIDNQTQQSKNIEEKKPIVRRNPTTRGIFTLSFSDSDSEYEYSDYEKSTQKIQPEQKEKPLFTAPLEQDFENFEDCEVLSVKPKTVPVIDITDMSDYSSNDEYPLVIESWKPQKVKRGDSPPRREFSYIREKNSEEENLKEKPINKQKVKRLDRDFLDFSDDYSDMETIKQPYEGKRIPKRKVSKPKPINTLRKASVAKLSSPEVNASPTILHNPERTHLQQEKKRKRAVKHKHL